MGFLTTMWFRIFVRLGVPIVLFIALLSWCIYEFTDEASDREREHNVETFNTAVDAWQGRGRQDFSEIQGIDIAFSEVFPEASVPAGQLDAVVTPSAVPKIDSSSDVEQFTDLHFEGSLDATLTQGWRRGAVHATVTLHLSHSRLPNHTVVLENTPITKETAYKTTNWKVCQNVHRGVLDQKDGTCYTYEVLNKICLTLRHATPLNTDRGVPAGDAAASSTPGFELSGGCTPTGSSDTPFLLYRVEAGPRYMNAEFLNTQARFSFDVVVRSESDPLLVALGISQGGHSFGQSRDQRLRLAWVLLALSIFFFFFAALTVWLNRSCALTEEEEDRMQRKKHRYTHGVDTVYTAKGGSSRKRYKSHSGSSFVGIDTAADSHTVSIPSTPGDLGVPGLPAHPPAPPPVGILRQVGEVEQRGQVGEAAKQQSDSSFGTAEHSSVGVESLSIELQARRPSPTGEEVRQV